VDKIESGEGEEGKEASIFLFARKKRGRVVRFQYGKQNSADEERRQEEKEDHINLLPLDKEGEERGGGGTGPPYYA